MAKPILNDNTVYLVDGSGYIFRAYFAIRNLSSKKGVPTNAVFGFTNMLVKLLKEHKPKYIGIAFDRKEKNFRKDIYQDYKANRTSPPEDLLPQFDLIHQVVKAFNIKLLSKPGFEADDIIGTLKKRAQSEGHEVVIVTGDKDLMQLVDDKSFLLDELRAIKNGTEQIIGKKQVKETMGVLPEHVIDLLALAGDASDNIPGVKGIGKKIAAELINEFGSVEQILNVAPLIKQKSRREKLMAGHKDALLSKQLVTIVQDMDLDCSIKDLKFSGIDEKKSRDLFLELDFHRLLNEKSLFQNKEHKNIKEEQPTHLPGYTHIDDEESFLTIFNQIKDQQQLSLSCKAKDNELIGLGLAWNDSACYVDLRNKAIKNKLNDLLSHHKNIIAANSKLELKTLMANGFSTFSIGGDPILANYLLNQEQQHSLQALSERYLDQKVTDDEAMKALVSLKLDKLMREKLKAQRLFELYQDLELPLIKVLARMEAFGVLIDTNKLAIISKELKERLNDLETKAIELAGTTFNPASPKQVATILFDTLNLPPVKKTKSGYSTDSMVLEKISHLHELPKILLQYRATAKLINTYIDTLPTLINPDTKRIHTSYNQFVTTTGRLSCSDPNLQNIPVRTPEGRRIRQAFVAKPGYSLISLDYSQVELRLLAYISKDPVLTDSFAKKEDVHQRTASEIFSLPQDEITKEQRSAAKTINFGILYGMGVQKLSQTLNISRKEAQTYLDKYFEKYKGVFLWKNKALEKAKKDKEVRTLFGRRRVLTELSSKSPMEQARGERIAINTPIQGTAADIIKKAMIDTDNYLQRYYADTRLIMQVHDELIIEAKDEDAKHIAQEISKIMRYDHGLDIDLEVDFAIAKNWDEAH